MIPEPAHDAFQLFRIHEMERQPQHQLLAEQEQQRVARPAQDERMVTQEVTINNEVGLHARPATFFIQKANEFKSGIWVEKDERRVNAKSLLGVLSLGITKGTTITLLADGSDEKEAVAALSELVSGNFGE